MPFSQASSPTRDLPKTASLSGLDRLHVDADRPTNRQAILRGASRKISDIGTRNERLRGRAARVDAGSADELALDQGDALAGSGESAGEGRPRLPRSDNNRVECPGHEKDLTIRTAPPIAITSSRSAVGRSLPPIAATSLVRNS
jgi:hypothetical protein